MSETMGVKASELIALLQTRIQRYGDLPVINTSEEAFQDASPLHDHEGDCVPLDPRECKDFSAIVLNFKKLPTS